MNEWKAVHGKQYACGSEQTVFGTLSHVFFKRNTAALVNAAHTCSTPLKLCRQRQISATAVHFSMAATRDCILFREIISDETSREPSLKRFVICEMCSACDFLFDFIHACPKNSLQTINGNFWWSKKTKRIVLYSQSLTRYECWQIFDDPNMSFAQQFLTPIAFRCSPYSTSINSNHRKRWVNDNHI